MGRLMFYFVIVIDLTAYIVHLPKDNCFKASCRTLIPLHLLICTQFDQTLQHVKFSTKLQFHDYTFAPSHGTHIPLVATRENHLVFFHRF